MSKTPIPILLAITGVLYLVPTEVQAQQGDAVARAETHHRRGVELFRSGQYRDAVREFEAAERLVHSRANLNNLAHCHQELGEHRQAMSYIDRYLAEPDLPADARARATQYRQEIVAAQSASGGGSSGGSLAGPWVLLGSGLALLLTGGVLDIVAYTRSGERDFTNENEYQDWRDGVSNLAIAGDVLVGVGAAVAVGGLIWLLVARSRSGGSSRSHGSLVSLSPSPRGGLFLQTRITF